MNKEESLALFAKGRDAWNAWAEKMFVERAVLEVDRAWVESRFERDWNDETRAWHAAAAADFVEHTYQESVDFSGFVFPGNADFRKATFKDETWFDGATISGDARLEGATFSGNARFREVTFAGDAGFDRATFMGVAFFSESTFSGDARFGGASFTGTAGFSRATFSGATFFSESTFTGDARFSGASFTGNVVFDKATFTGETGFDDAIFTGDAQFGGVSFTGAARFHEATFTGDVWFSKATFTGDARFGGVSFTGTARFDGATFSGAAFFGESIFTGAAWFAGAKFTGDAGFLRADFEGYTTFDRATFEGSATFRAIEAKSLFTFAGATFLAVPDFIQAHFAEAPRLDDSRIGPRGFWQLFLARIKENFNGDPDLAARWRASKRLAIQGHDHAREQAFFKGELKARRWSEDKPWHAVFWFGVFYQGLSDFGRSILRPLMWLGASVFGFAGLYLVQNPVLAKESSSVISELQRIIGFGSEVPPLTCVAGRGEPFWSALLLSAQKGLVFFGQVPINKLNQIYACLYGIHTVDGAQPSQLPESFSPLIPNSVTFLGFLQTPLSAALIFLFLLAIRNHFRIK